MKTNLSGRITACRRSQSPAAWMVQFPVSRLPEHEAVYFYEYRTICPRWIECENALRHEDQFRMNSESATCYARSWNFSVRKCRRFKRVSQSEDGIRRISGRYVNARMGWRTHHLIADNGPAAAVDSAR